MERRYERCASLLFHFHRPQGLFLTQIDSWVNELDNVGFDDDNEDGMHIENRRELITTHKFRRC